jgi:copper chaperone
MTDIKIAISGMSCGHCLNAVSKALHGVHGIEVTSVQMGRAEIRVPGPDALERAKAAIEEAGYKVEGTLA